MKTWVQKYATWHTRQLMDERQIIASEMRSNRFADDDSIDRQKALYEELNRREHVPNKAEAKALRRERQKAKQNR